MSVQRKADLSLVMVTLFWGVSYYLMDLCLEDLAPLNLNAFRFLLAFFVLGAVFFKKLRRVNRTELRWAVAVGLLLTVTYIGATYGVKYTSISNAGFVCALPVVLTPVFDRLVFRRRAGKKLGFALAMCTVGLALMTLGEDFRPAVGDVICLLCAVAYSFDLLLVERAVKNPNVDALRLGVCQLGVVGVVMLVLSLLFEQPHLPSSPRIWAFAAFLGLFCSGVAFVVQAVAQKYTTASHVGLIFTLEPVFSAVVAFAFAGEKLLPRGYLGAALMLLSLVLMELDTSKLKIGKSQ